ncbi:MAG: hypothetical protein SF028_04320 [Candidatus Sumerlaeia bacterium]|nr:hypothetical protein [Candidatus Sumerlaeia bacterium]
MLFERRFKSSWNATRLLAGALRGNPLLRLWNPFRRRGFQISFALMLGAMAVHAYQGIVDFHQFQTTSQVGPLYFAIGNAFAVLAALGPLLVIATVLSGWAGPLPGGEDADLRQPPLSSEQYAAARLLLVLGPLLIVRLVLYIPSVASGPPMGYAALPFWVVESALVYSYRIASGVTLLALPTYYIARRIPSRVGAGLLSIMASMLLSYAFWFLVDSMGPLAWGRRYDRHMSVFRPNLHELLQRLDPWWDSLCHLGLAFLLAPPSSAFLATRSRSRPSSLGVG